MACILKCHARAPQSLDVDWLDAEHWLHTKHLVGYSSGRNKAYFIDYQENKWVLRHYYRGGLVGKVNRDQFLYTGRQRTRAFAEFDLLTRMHKLGLPVPKVVAARICRNGLWYRNDILIERLDAKDLLAVLAAKPLTKAQYQQLGQVIAQFHQHKLYHADLNIKNILFDGDQFYLIDFDRGEFRENTGSWCQSNLKRLLRSFRKEAQRHAPLHWSESDWQALESGYREAMIPK
ncbi:3-deoxy-D-manno-octulosonic acid kinase [Paraferrimonas sedimenticola]|uniref:3-deoxy-D-manno-octulosonic acid kinase n=1 Tax=Paraferrimonas sedimenticola TaxID=375674 RepID=A0AA37RYC3_9GAMM|nr:3-deoxy-D-manno-octulosonic acid kinase [Paraferrimonas sedimenticola]GLP97533.1 3-deoxy-D-manno-octulosonic acid kinase [Paraferrimonas sedimenticola]